VGQYRGLVRKASNRRQQASDRSLGMRRGCQRGLVLPSMGTRLQSTRLLDAAAVVLRPLRTRPSKQILAQRSSHPPVPAQNNLAIAGAGIAATATQPAASRRHKARHRTAWSASLRHHKGPRVQACAQIRQASIAPSTACCACSAFVPAFAQPGSGWPNEGAQHSPTALGIGLSRRASIPGRYRWRFPESPSLRHRG